MKRPALLFAAVALVFGAGGIYFGMRHHAPQTSASSSTAMTFFAQQLPDATGTQQALSQWQGRPLVVNFWATWCPPCVEEMPELSALQAELALGNLQIIGIGVDSPSNIRDFTTRYKIAYPVYVAGLTGTDLARGFGNQGGGLPFTVLLDKKGHVVKTYLGRLKMEQLRADIAAL
jgi:thiol-disulfide isomerase/thioredoxin